MSTPSSSKPSLPLTLAARVQHLREALDLTPRQLSRKSLVSLEMIEDIEAGVELFLAPSVRLQLCRALRVKPSVIQEVEIRVEEEEYWDFKAFGPEEAHLLRQMAQRPEATYTCLKCKAPMVVREFHRRDMEDNPIRVIKAHCTQCLFQLASE